MMMMVMMVMDGDDDEYTNLCNFRFLLFLFLYSSPSISLLYLSLYIIVIIIASVPRTGIWNTTTWREGRRKSITAVLYGGSWQWKMNTEKGDGEGSHKVGGR
jgi:hypothetical protein